MIDSSAKDLQINFSDDGKLSVRDPRYAIHIFTQSIQNKLIQANSFTEKIYEFVLKEASPTLQVAESFKKGSRFVVDMSKSTKKAIDSGLIKLVKENGAMKAQLRDANGNYSTKLDITEEFFNKGIDPIQMVNALQMKAMQEQLQQITDQIVMINSSVIDVLQGQQNDRIALFYSGIELYLEAKFVKDKNIKSALIAQAIRALSDGVQQLKLTMESDIEFLTTQQYDKIRKKRSETAQPRIDNINKAFGYIHQASLARAAIYCEQDEYMAMYNVLDEYSRFIENTVARNANVLSQWDERDDGTSKGVWHSRANLKLDTDKIRNVFLTEAHNEYYLCIEDGNSEN